MADWSKVTAACEHRYDVRSRKVGVAKKDYSGTRTYVDLFYIYDLHTGKQVGKGAYQRYSVDKKVAMLEKEYNENKL